MTKRNLSVLLSIFLLPTVSLRGQALGEFGVCNSFPSIVSLVRDNSTYIMYASITAPFMSSTMKYISEGDFVKQGDQLTFKDKRLGVEVKAVFLNGNLLRFTSGFPFLEGQTYEGVVGDPKMNAKVSEYYNKLWSQWEYPHEKIETLRSIPAPRKLSSGIYQNDYAFVRVRSNKEYELYYAAKLISNGTWKQENSCIILEDKGLKCNFYMGLDSNAELHSLLLPGFYAPEEQWLPFNKIDKFPEGTGDVPYEYETIEVIVPDSEFGSCISD